MARASRRAADLAPTGRNHRVSRKIVGSNEQSRAIFVISDPAGASFPHPAQVDRRFRTSPSCPRAAGHGRPPVTVF
jgi:hypothetical protein